MPRGIYQRTPGLKRRISEETRQKFRENLEKARKSIVPGEISEKVICARQKNAFVASKVKSARSILKHLPLGATAGTKFTMNKTRSFCVIDPVPVRSADGEHWEQKFSLGGYAIVYGVRKDFSGVARIVWDYEPTIENILDKPVLETIE